MAYHKQTGIEQTLTTLFPSHWIRQQAAAVGWLRRIRKVNPVAFFWTLLLGFGVAQKRSLAALRRAYESVTGTSIEESSFYDRFTPALVALLKAAVTRAMTQVSTKPAPSLQGLLASFRDLLLADSTVIRLHRLLRNAYAACRTNHTQAAAKIHWVMSVLAASPTRIRITPERINDRSPWRRVGPWIKGCLVLFDLGYFGYRLFDLIDRNGGYFLTRLKANANPTIVAVHRQWRGRARPLVGRKLQEVVQGLHREVLDALVEVRFARRSYRGQQRQVTRTWRIVGIRDAETGQYHLYITNIPADLLPAEDVAKIYALRWQVELLFKELKSHYRLDQLPSSKEPIVEALLYAAILTLIASKTLLDALRMHLARARRIPALRWAAIFATFAPTLLPLVLHAAGMGKGVRSITEILLAEAIDPNTRRVLALDALAA